MTDITVKNFNRTAKLYTFLDRSKRLVVFLDSIVVGRGEYLPGWRWSKHAGPQTGKNSEAHIGYVISGRMIIKTASGKEITVGPGDAFEVQPGHDAWVVGNEPCIALDFEYLK
jgi:quercetin dioxygenase-like cupin family protein